MKNSALMSAILMLGVVFCHDAAFAKGKGKGEAGGKKGKKAAVAKANETSEEITGTIKVEGEFVKLVTTKGTSYYLSTTAAEENKGNNGKKVTMKGIVTTIEGKTWLSVESTIPATEQAPGKSKAKK